MKIIIDIPDHIYRTLIETGKYGYYAFDAKKAIKKGKRLPKGHGDLIDVTTLDDVIMRMNEKDAQITRNEYKLISNVLAEMKIIIEADSGE